MNLLYGLLAGVLSYFVAHLVFNDTVSGLIGLIIAIAVAFRFSRSPRNF